MPTYLDAVSREKLRKLCKFGRLFEADRLLTEKGTARFRKTHKWTPLFVAVDRGFHSLVEVLLRYEHEPWDLEKAYSGALRRRRNDLAAMILKSPWWTREIDPVEAICTGDVELVKSMILAGTDFTKAPIIRNAAMNNPMGAIACLRSVGILLESVEGQLYEALMHHADNGHFKRMMAMLRAGLDPHKRIVICEYPDGTQETGNVVEAVIHTGKPWLLEMLKPSPEKDDAEHLVGCGMHLGDRRMLEVLIKCGFTINCQQNGGSPAMHSVLTTAGLFRISPNSRGLDSYGWSRFVTDIEWLIGIGAKWVGRNSGEYRMIRDALLGIGETGAIQILNMLLVGGAVSRSELKEILRTPRMDSLATKHAESERSSEPSRLKGRQRVRQ